MLFPSGSSATAPIPLALPLYPCRNFQSNKQVEINPMNKKDTYRIVTRGVDGSLRIRDFPSAEPIFALHSQIGVDDSSADLELRGMPVFRGLIGPIPEGRNIVRYESPEVFESVTKEWSSMKIRRRRRRTAAPDQNLNEV